MAADHTLAIYVAELILLLFFGRLLGDIKAHEGSMVEITGLIKQSDIRRPGVGLAGGRVRITPVMPNGRTSAPDPGPSPPILDVESYRLLNASCPNRG